MAKVKELEKKEKDKTAKAAENLRYEGKTEKQKNFLKKILM